VSIALGLQGGIPASLLFVAATEDEIDLVMDYPLRVIDRALAIGAGTLMHTRHGKLSAVEIDTLWRIKHLLANVQIGTLFLD